MLPKELTSQIRHAFLQNLIPGIFLWIIAITICFSYYFAPSAQPVFEAVATLKVKYGIVYSSCATALFGGLIPFLYFLLTKQTGKSPVAELTFYLLFWGMKGIEVDLFYRLQGIIFGTDNSISTVFIKTLVDQGFYAPFWAVPTIAIAYLYKESGFKIKSCLAQVDRRFITLTIPTIVLSNMIVWLPSVTIIYLMPPNLQVPLFNLVQCFFALLLNILGKKSANNSD
ncbi:hypothetical protein [Desulfopila sp. IMCC35008]|uniref:hypothetical protein n=1 Tax=Desulfopila sp. IMCC35008 TaxID=2653858 RepID=UPI0013D16821|nr:hypothetical protein [Desulfopila sp. IMCC35008]